jgi:hypothetical protein
VPAIIQALHRCIPKPCWDILEDDKDSVCWNTAPGRNQFGQLDAERVSFCVRNSDAAELEKSCGGLVTSKCHLLDRHEASHNVGFGFVQLCRNDLGRGCREVIALFLRDIDVGLNRQIRHGWWLNDSLFLYEAKTLRFVKTFGHRPSAALRILRRLS